MTDTGVARDQLRAFVERIERLEDEKKSIADDIREVYAEAKGNGFDTKVLRMVVKIRKQDKAERAEQEALLDLYLHALGMVPMDEAAEGPHSASRKGDALSGLRKIAKENGMDISMTVGGKTVTLAKGKKAKAENMAGAK